MFLIRKGTNQTRSNETVTEPPKHGNRKTEIAAARRGYAENLNET